VKLLLDTHLLLWSALGERLSTDAIALIKEPSNTIHFSVASIWEVAIKAGLGRDSFTFDAQFLRRGLLDNGYIELPITGDHAVSVGRLPLIHKDPFDRLLVAQATVEGITLVTADPVVARYPGPIRHV